MNHSPQFYTEYIMLVWFMIGFEIWKRITKHWCTQTYYWCWQAMNLCLLNIKTNNVNRLEYRCIFSKQNHGNSCVYIFVFWMYIQHIQHPNFFWYEIIWYLEDSAVYSVIFCLEEELWYLLCSRRRIRTLCSYSDFSVMEDFKESQGNWNSGRKYCCQNTKCKIYISGGNTFRKDFDLWQRCVTVPPA